MRGYRVCLLLVSLTVQVAAAPEEPATADSAADAEPARTRALELFKQAREHYRSGEFQSAIRLLRQAHDVYPEPLLLYNLGRAYESAGAAQPSIDAYRRYLRAAPATPDRGAIEQRIVTLQTQLEERERLRSPPPTPRPTPAEPSRSLFVPPWLVAGTGAVAMGVGAYFGVRAGDLHDDATAEQDALAAEQHQRDAEQAATIATISLVAGGALVVGGVSWGILSVSGGRDDAGLMLSGRF